MGAAGADRIGWVVHEISTWPGKENGLIFKGPSSELFALADSWTEAARWLSVLHHKPSRTIRAGTDAVPAEMAFGRGVTLSVVFEPSWDEMRRR